MQRLLFTFCLVLLPSLPIMAEIINVPDDFETIQAGIEEASDGDTVLVAAGEYAENIDFSGKAITVMSISGAGETIINGGGEGPCVVFLNGEGRESALQGFTLTNGTATGDGYGGGILIERSSPVVESNIITGNTASQGGGGISASADGCQPLIRYNLIYDNESNGGGGGGISLYQCGGVILNNTICSNSAPQGGGGINVPFTTGVQILNNIVTGNTNQGVGGWQTQDLLCRYNNVWNNQGGDYGNIQAGEGSISVDPLFVDADNDDYHLTENSPCIDAGDPESPDDPDGTRADMGAFYFQQDNDPNRHNVPNEYATIQAAIDASENGDTVLVQPGEYVECIDFSGKDIFVGSLYLLTGEEEAIERTIVDGDSTGSVVSFTNGETTDAVLVGMTIRHGFSDGNGGGINCANSSPSILNCHIRNNYAETRGGGINCEPESNAIISNCLITENTVGSGGGGIWCGENSNPVITDCIIVANEARWNGGGINMYIDCAPVIRNCEICDNTAGSKGGGIIASQDCSPEIRECVFMWNRAATGGAIAVERRAAPDIRNCLFFDNFGDLGSSIAVMQDAAAALINCTVSWSPIRGWTRAVYSSASRVIFINTIIHGISPLEIAVDSDSAASSLTLTRCDIAGGRESIDLNDNGEVNWLQGNIDETPLFVDFGNMDFNLSEYSPCIDAGTAFFAWEDDTLINLSEEDYNGFAPDMGALESDFAGVIPETGPLPESFDILSIYPNPFNSSTTITYSLPVQSPATLNIYNTRGQLVDVLLDRVMSAGRHFKGWNAAEMPAGIYWVKLEGGGKKDLRKVVLVR